MVSKTDISVIIPFYNNAHSICRAVDSVLSQTYPIREILIVDDHSSDDLAGAIKTLPYDKLHVLRHDFNRGASAARNTGIQAAKGDFVAFLDADDAWHPTKLQRQVNALEAGPPEARGCVGGFTLYREGNPHPQIYHLRPRKPLWREMVWGCRLSPGSTLLVERDVYKTVGYYDEKLRRLEDWEWLIRFSAFAEFTMVREPIADVYLTHVRGVAHLPPTIEALNYIEAQYIPYFSNYGFVVAQQFRSALVLERAAAYARAGQTIPAALAMAKTFFTWPIQRRTYFEQALRALSGIVR